MYESLYIKENFLKILKLILPEFVKESSPSKLVNGTKNGCQNMVNRRRKIVIQNWLAEQKISFKIGNGTKIVFHFWLVTILTVNQKSKTFFVPLTNFEGQFWFINQN
jgi:hypothetical protein